MRFIDADALLENQPSCCRTSDWINAAPTIDAIPVEWLEEHDSEGNEYERRYITVVEALSMWQKEQEGKHAADRR